jgi:hypothetical protein
MARTESLEALGRDYAINFGSQSVSSNREQPADPRASNDPMPPLDDDCLAINGWLTGWELDAVKNYGRACYEAGQATPKAEPPADPSAWWALAMCAAAYLEDAANCLRDEDAKRAALGAAKHVRDRCAALALAQRPAEPASDKQEDA